MAGRIELPPQLKNAGSVCVDDAGAVQPISKSTIAFNIGWDAAIYDLPYYESWPDDFRDGWVAGQSKRSEIKESSIFSRKWVQLRVGAYMRDKPFSEDVTPNYLAMILTGFCPATLGELTFAEKLESDWSVDRVDNNRGYERQNLLVMSVRANKAKGELSVDAIASSLKSREAIGDLSLPESVRLWQVVRQFVYRDMGSPHDLDSFYVGEVVAPDAPLNCVMATQVLLSIAIANRSGTLRTNYIDAARRFSREQGCLKFFNRHLKRLYKYHNKSMSCEIVHPEWDNDRNLLNHQKWLLGLSDVARTMFLNISLELYSGTNDIILARNLESWAVSDNAPFVS